MSSKHRPMSGMRIRAAVRPALVRVREIAAAAAAQGGGPAPGEFGASDAAAGAGRGECSGSADAPGALPVERLSAGAPLVLVALSGGADSLALAAAVAAEAVGAGVRAGAVVIDHGLQEGSAEVAARAADAARRLGLEPVLVRRVRVATRQRRAERQRPTDGLHLTEGQAGHAQHGGQRHAAGGPEAAAREARYTALAEAAREYGAGWILTAHTRDDQSEQTLLALARGSGVRSLAGIPPERGLAPGVRMIRPLLAERWGIARRTTEEACAEWGLDAWQDPHNSDPAFARARVRTAVLPVLERELGPGVAGSLARTADLAREDADALDALAERIVALAAPQLSPPVAVQVAVLAEQPAALRGRAIRIVASRAFGSHLAREHTLAVATLVTDWRGQGPVFVPGLRVTRRGSELVFERQIGSPRRTVGDALQ